jgi:hypothetical protein
VGIKSRNYVRQWTFGSSLVMTAVNGTNGSKSAFSTVEGCSAALKALLHLTQDEVPKESLPLIDTVAFKSVNDGSPYFPCPLKETEAISALKAVEAGVAASIANLVYGERQRRVTVDVERATCFLFSAYLCTVRGMNKSNPSVKSCLKGRHVKTFKGSC